MENSITSFTHDDSADYYLEHHCFLCCEDDAGDPFTGLIDPNIDPAIIEQNGLQQVTMIQSLFSISVGLVIFAGDFGQSILFKQPVVDVIMQRLNNTIWLSLLTMVLTYLIALPLGMIAGRYQNSLADKIIGVYNF